MKSANHLTVSSLVSKKEQLSLPESGARSSTLACTRSRETWSVKGNSGLCGFKSTNLEFLLGQSGAKNVVLGGFLTNCCVESTMRSGYERGFKVYTLKDCVAATSLPAQDATLEYNFGRFSVVTTSDQILEVCRYK